MSNPAIVLVSGDNLDVLEQQFWRYTREYDVRCAPTAADAKREAMDVLTKGGQVALFVVESVLPDMDIHPAIGKICAAVPTARRVVVSHGENFRRDATDLRHGQANGKYDTFLLQLRDYLHRVGAPAASTCPTATRVARCSRATTGRRARGPWPVAETGQEPELDEDHGAALLEGMRPIEDMLRTSGQYGARVPVAADAPVVDRQMGFIGRDPAWSR